MNYLYPQLTNNYQVLPSIQTDNGTILARILSHFTNPPPCHVFKKYLPELWSAYWLLLNKSC